MDDRFKFPADREARNAARVKALEALLIRKGVISSKTVDTVLNHFETKMGPFNGAKVVARAWVDAALGRLGGRKGGKARAARLSPERRQEIARKAARARWARRRRG